MKKILSFLFLSCLLILSSCGNNNNDNSNIPNSNQGGVVDEVTFEGEFIVEGIGAVGGYEPNLTGDEILTLYRFEDESNNTVYVYIPKDMWEQYNVSQTIFVKGNHLYFKGGVQLLTADTNGHYYMALEVLQIHEFVN